MVSDDTEHTCLVLRSLLESNGNPAEFQRRFARRLRWWLLSLPAGTGLATARAIFKLLLGVPPTRSGVYSAGNGPAMRAAILGVMLPLEEIRPFVDASTTLTHTDPKANWGAHAIALAAYLASRSEYVAPIEYLDLLKGELANDSADEFLSLMECTISSLMEFGSTAEFSSQICSRHGVSGYVYQTVPVTIHCWLRNQRNFREAIREVIRCGGDADTTAAIVGGIVGASVGPQGIPADWQQGLRDWPVSVSSLHDLANLAIETTISRENIQSRLHFPGQIVRNLFFLAIVLFHGFRRLFPPF